MEDYVKELIHNQANMKYRGEIDGLRALAVISVILFHAGFKVLGGGFVGVDIFFVISGYLITTIIFAEINDGSFSLASFYERRARRILPALYFVMLICIPISMKLMLPDDLKNFGESLVATVLFSNNILLLITSDYWALASEFKPLLHTWSLGVEEQYYLFFPVFLLVSWHFFKRRIVHILFLCALISLGVSQWLVEIKPEFNFYFLITRSWELLIGSLASFYLLRKDKIGIEKSLVSIFSQIMGFIGVLFIMFSIFSFNNETPYPSVYALLPTIGSALIIIFSNSKTFVGKLLGCRLLVWIGLISYSTYLWHQPIFAFARLLSLDEPNYLIMSLCVSISFGLGVLTWRYIEMPFRKIGVASRKMIVIFSVGIGLSLTLIGFEIYLNSGFIHLHPELNSGITEAGRGLNKAFNKRVYQYKNLNFNSETKRHILIVGNSFARDFINMGLENSYFSSGEISYSDEMPFCIKEESDLNPTLRNLIVMSDYLIYGSSINLKCWKNDIQLLKNMGVKKIIIIGTKNFGWNLNAVMRLEDSKKFAYRAKVLKNIWDENDEMKRTLPNEYFVNILALISDDDKRVPVFTDDLKIISQDRTHLTKSGAKFLGKVVFDHPLLVDLK